KNKTAIRTNEKGELLVNVSEKDLRKWKARGVVHYSDFRAKGDGKTDDINAIAATHAFANEFGLPVKADGKATYYISGKKRPVTIQTDTDFGTANFIIDDTNVEDRTANVFVVTSAKPVVSGATDRDGALRLEGISSLKRNQKKIDVALPGTCIVTVTNANVRRYIRFGLNQNNGSAQTDIFIVDKHGNVDMDAPIIWDFDDITDIRALPID